jgi:hypothetical protein
MKKYLFLSLMAFATLGTTVSCDRSTEVVQQTDNDTYPMMRDIRGTFNAANIQTTDVVLVYRNINSGNSNGAVWQLLPKTEYLSNSRELDYNFLFNTTNLEIYTEANFDQATMTAAEATTYLNNQQFRVVLVPASQGKNANVDYRDYNSVIRFYNLDDSHVKGF